MTNYDELALRAENGELAPKGKALRGSAAAESGRKLLMDATGADTVEAAVSLALGRPRLDAAAAPAAVTWKVRTTASLDREVREAAKARGVTVSQLVREAVASYVHAS